MQPDPKPRRHPWRLLFVTLLISFGALEVVLRMGKIPGYAPDQLRPSIEVLQEKSMSNGHPYLAYVPKSDYETDHGKPYRKTSHNAAGYRGPLVAKPKPEGVYRVLCLGGSSTHGQTPNTDEDTWPARLQVHLRDLAPDRKIEVINFGVYGYSTFESLVNLSFRGLEYEPDLVLVYHTINDMRCALYKLGGEVQTDNSHWRAIWPKVMPSPGESTLEKSLVYSALRKRFTHYLDRFKTLDAFAIVNYDPSHPDPYAGPTSDVGFDSFRRNLRSIHAIARSAGAEVMFISQACDREDILSGSRKEQWQAMDRMTQILQESAHKLGAAYCDAAPALEVASKALAPEVEALQQQSKELAKNVDSTEDQAKADALWMRFSKEAIFTGEVHLTDRGADLLAQTVAQTIRMAGFL